MEVQRTGIIFHVIVFMIFRQPANRRTHSWFDSAYIADILLLPALILIRKPVGMEKINPEYKTNRWAVSISSNRRVRKEHAKNRRGNKLNDNI